MAFSWALLFAAGCLAAFADNSLVRVSMGGSCSDAGYQRIVAKHPDWLQWMQNSYFRALHALAGDGLQAQTALSEIVSKCGFIPAIVPGPEPFDRITYLRERFFSYCSDLRLWIENARSEGCSFLLDSCTASTASFSRYYYVMRRLAATWHPKPQSMGEWDRLVAAIITSGVDMEEYFRQFQGPPGALPDLNPETGSHLSPLETFSQFQAATSKQQQQQQQQ